MQMIDSLGLFVHAPILFGLALIGVAGLSWKIFSAGKTVSDGANDVRGGVRMQGELLDCLASGYRDECNKSDSELGEMHSQSYDLKQEGIDKIKKGTMGITESFPSVISAGPTIPTSKVDFAVMGAEEISEKIIKK